MTKRKANPKVQHQRTRHPTKGYFVPASKHVSIDPPAGVMSTASPNEQPDAHLHSMAPMNTGVHPGKKLDVEKLLR